MSNGLDKKIAQISKIHEELMIENRISYLDFVLDYIENYEDDVQELYLNILIQYYFQKNQVENFRELYTLGYNFDLKMEDIKLAFLNITSDEESVIELLENDIVFLKVNDYESSLKMMYEHYKKSNDELKGILDKEVDTLKKNSYLCAYCYKNRKYDFARFFLDEDILKSIREDLPFLLR